MAPPWGLPIAMLSLDFPDTPFGCVTVDSPVMPGLVRIGPS